MCFIVDRYIDIYIYDILICMPFWKVSSACIQRKDILKTLKTLAAYFGSLRIFYRRCIDYGLNNVAGRPAIYNCGY